MWVWLLDRGAALAGYAVLWFALLTGIAYNARGLGWLHRASRVAHVPASVLASAAVLIHVVVGLADAALVFLGAVPHPSFPDSYLAIGLGMGVVALLVLVTATLAFLDPKQFERPWDPRLVHAFAYGGFAFATIHAIAIGTDVAGLLQPALLAATAFLLVALVVRVASPGPAKAAS